MPKITLYHNPKCSNSRGALALLKAAGIEPQVVEYLKTPLSIAVLEDLIARSSGTASDFVRYKEPEAKAQGLSPDQDAATLIDALTATPKLLQRPIVDLGNAVVIARPPETLEPYLENKSERSLGA